MQESLPQEFYYPSDKILILPIINRPPIENEIDVGMK